MGAMKQALLVLALLFPTFLSAQSTLPFFCITDNNIDIHPTVPLDCRRWHDSYPTAWQNANPSHGVYKFEPLDSNLAYDKSMGIEQEIFTLSGTPTWASSKPTDLTCSYAAGVCDPPNDVNADGSGTDQHWKDWVTAIASHTLNVSYLESHAHITIWEIWNEVDVPLFWTGTMAQLQRMTMDARIIIKGFDSNALIGTPSTHPYTKGEIATLNAYLYGPNGSARNVDVIIEHCKPGLIYPTTIEAAMTSYMASVRAILQPAELAKPLIIDEGGYAPPGQFNPPYTSNDMAASAVARLFIMSWSLNVKSFTWYTWDDLKGYQTAVVAWSVLYSWIHGATLTAPCSAVGTVWRCNYTQANARYQLIWDTSKACTATACPSSPQGVVAFKKYSTIDGAAPVTITNGSVPVGIKPARLSLH